MQCKDCKHWQGTKYSKWGDCHRLVAKLQPELFDCILTDENGTIQKFFTVPFDPHDAKYWSSNIYFQALYENAIDDVLIYRSQLGIRVQTVVKDDIIFDSQNGERVGRVRLHFFQTHKEYTCEDS